MKRFALVLAVLLTSLSLAHAGTSGATIPDGTYEAQVRSVNPEINDTKAVSHVSHVSGTLIAKVQFQNGTSEEWIVSGKKLTQKEFDATGKLTRQYSANEDDNSQGSQGDGTSFAINCANRAQNTCDAGIDARHTWTLRPQSNGFSYIVSGVADEARNDRSVTPARRHELAFHKVASK